MICIIEIFFLYKYKKKLSHIYAIKCGYTIGEITFHESFILIFASSISLYAVSRIVVKIAL